MISEMVHEFYSNQFKKFYEINERKIKISQKVNFFYFISCRRRIIYQKLHKNLLNQRILFENDPLV